LKSGEAVHTEPGELSLPARGAWIEIGFTPTLHRYRLGRSPHGERGLKYLIATAFDRQEKGRSPHGERGLKSQSQRGKSSRKQSLPARGAWIEIEIYRRGTCDGDSRSPHGERGLKLYASQKEPEETPSLPARGAWIEICSDSCTEVSAFVAPRTGSVD